MNAVGAGPKRARADQSVAGKGIKAPSKREVMLAGRIMSERKAIATMALKIRRKSKEIAASADRLLSRVF